MPLLVGGAALSEKFTRPKIAPAYGAPTCYAKDAMTGLRLMNEIMDPAAREARAAPAHTRRTPPRPRPSAVTPARRGRPGASRRRCAPTFPIPAAPYLDRKVRDVPHLAEIWSYINPYMLYGRHLGYKGNFEKALAEREAKALELFHNMEEVKQRGRRAS